MMSFSVLPSLFLATALACAPAALSPLAPAAALRARPVPDTTLTAPAAAPPQAAPFLLADNTELVYQLLDGSGKRTGELRQRVVRLREQEREESKKRRVPEQTALLKSGRYDKKNVLQHLQDLTFRARRDTCFTDGMAELDPDALRPFRDRKLTYEPVPVAWPNHPTTGTELPDGGVSVRVSSSVVNIATVSTMLRKRRVVSGPTALTTPAGTFQCYQIEAEREEATVPRPDMAMRSTARQVDYYAPGVGVVRTELYGRNGKLAQVRELTARTTTAAPAQEKVKYKVKKS